MKFLKRLSLVLLLCAGLLLVSCADIVESLAEDIIVDTLYEIGEVEEKTELMLGAILSDDRQAAEELSSGLVKSREFETIYEHCRGLLLDVTDYSLVITSYTQSFGGLNGSEYVVSYEITIDDEIFLLDTVYTDRAGFTQFDLSLAPPDMTTADTAP